MAPKKRKANATLADDEWTTKKLKTTAPTTSMRITRNMKTDGPRQAVFNTVELLESILLEVPIKQLFTIRRTCKQFRDCVNKSVRLQEKMFLRPSKREKESWTLHEIAPHEDFPGMRTQKFEFIPTAQNAPNKVEHIEPKTPARLNSCVGVLRKPNQGWIDRFARGFTRDVDIRLEQYLERSGSFEGVYLTDPPCTRLSAILYLDLNTSPRSHFRFKDWAHISDPAGITMGKLVTALMDSEHEIADWDPITDRRDIIRKASMSQVVAEQIERKKTGSIFNTAALSVMPRDVVIPTEREWEEVRRRSAAA